MEALIHHRRESTVDTLRIWSKHSKLNTKWLGYQGDWQALPSALSRVGGLIKKGFLKHHNPLSAEIPWSLKTPTWSKP